MIKQLIDELLQNEAVTLMDVGATGGAHSRWQLFGDKCSTVLVDADNEQEDDSGQDYIFTAFGAQVEKSVEFNLANKRECSSLLSPNQDFLKNFYNSSRFNIAKKANVTITTIDTFIQNSQYKKIDFLKIDAQGYSYEILSGAKESLKNSILGIEIELEFDSIYKNQKLFSNSFELLREFGFELVDISPIKWQHLNGLETGSPGSKIVFCDALFVKSPYDKKHNNLVLKKIACFLLAYGYFDFAQSVMNTFNLLKDDKIDQFNALSTLEEFLQYDLNFVTGNGISMQLNWFSKHIDQNQMFQILTQQSKNKLLNAKVKQDILRYLRYYQLEKNLKLITQRNEQLVEKIKSHEQKYNQLLESKNKMRDKVKHYELKYNKLFNEYKQYQETLCFKLLNFIKKGRKKN